MNRNFISAVINKFNRKSVGCFLFLISFIACLDSFGQTDSLKTIAGRFNDYRSKELQEKIFVHHDRPLYLSGETVWLKIYCVDATFHKPLTLSKVAYVEILDKSQNPVLQAKVALDNGFGKASFDIPEELSSGYYTLRVYTSWMKNFNPQFYFHSTLTILNTTKKLGPEFRKEDTEYDVQFFPEGGNLVNGLTSKVAFKVSNSEGNGVDFNGELRTKNGKVITGFKPLKFGMGHFFFTAVNGEEYQAILTLPDGKEIVKKLPRVFDKGYVMNLENLDKTQLQVTVRSNNQTHLNEPVYLLVHTRNVIALAKGNLLEQGKAIFNLNKKDLDEGISHLTVFNSKNLPVCERLYFKRPAEVLAISAKTDRVQYNVRKKVVLDIETYGKQNKRSPANLSLAVYKIDSLQSDASADITSFLWLNSDLKGHIENPRYYLKNSSPQADSALDNLMLTQGWSRFKWYNVLSDKNPEYEFMPEINGHLITGRITDTQTGKAAHNITAYLSAPDKKIALYNSTSDENGIVRFETQDFYGFKELIVQTDLRKDSTYKIELFDPFSEKYSKYGLERIDVGENQKALLVKRNLGLQTQNAYFNTYKQQFKIPVTDSVPFYGKPDERYFLDDYTRFKTLEEVLQEYVEGVEVRNRKDGYHIWVYDRLNKRNFLNAPMVLLDGIPVFNINPLMAVDALKIQRLDVLTNKFFQGNAAYEGIASFSTYRGDLADFKINPAALVKEYEGLQLEREFYAPQYDTPESLKSRLPDLRNLLYWSPEIKTKGEEQKVSFYTSDETGKYLVVIQGINADGMTGATQATFEVK
ncbi:MG2 domain-containing protein [Rubrolithibacter danxiaensis]|uniref:MG2 domain-containing protein n=1 Tax=Rubrolithibacter danxiaensis TaxID=3390805 RepID=UPI003BF802F8